MFVQQTPGEMFDAAGVYGKACVYTEGVSWKHLFLAPPGGGKDNYIDVMSGNILMAGPVDLNCSTLYL